mmetsp:Transcript_93/g.223  ORF Transcript_93/g.223 Transcript_93/m.223 type:complete len:87 (+) Transcript_93:1069-1329(+)
MPAAPDSEPTNISVIQSIRYDALNRPTSLSPRVAAMAPITPILQKSEDRANAAGKYSAENVRIRSIVIPSVNDDIHCLFTFEEVDG